MIIPNNGKVVIIDDKIDQVAKLMQALSKKNVPFVYFQDENGEDLPDQGEYLKNVRLIFLDIVLDTGIQQADKNVVSTALSRIDRIVGDNNGPYFIFIWSTQYERYGQQLIHEVNTSHLFVNKRPIAFIEINKTDLNEHGFDVIIDALQREIKNFDSLNAFFYWESIINDSAGDITNELISLINREDDWNQDTKNVLYRLSSAYWGLSIKNFAPKENIQKMLGAYSTLNQVLSDRIDYNTNICYNPILNDILVSGGDKNPNLFAKINEKIHVDNNPQMNLSIPGSTIFCIEELENEIKEISRKFTEKIIQITERNKKHSFSEFEETISKKQQEEKKIVISIEEIIKEKRITLNSIISDSLFKSDEKEIDPDLRKNIINDSLYIEVNISPRCDFAQNKLKNHRFLPGVLVPDKYKRELNKNAEYNYVSDFTIHLNGVLYLFLFDYRHFYSLRKLPSNYSSAFRIKENFLNELQVKLSGHISRLGLLYMS